MLEPEDYVSLLKAVSALQIESNDFNVVYNAYLGFSLMLDIQESIEIQLYEAEVTELWKAIGENTIR